MALLEGARTAWAHRHDIVRAGRAVGRAVRTHVGQQARGPNRPRPRQRERVVKRAESNDHAEQHSGHTNMLIKVVKPSLKHKTFGRWHYHGNISQYLVNVAGEQFCGEIVFIGTPTQMVNTIPNPAPGKMSLNIGLGDMNPYKGTTGSVNLIGQNSPAEDRFIWLAYNGSLEMANMSIVTAHMDIYLVVAKGNHDIGPIVAWNAGYSQEAMGQPSIGQPGAGTIVGVAGYENNVDVGAIPSQSPQFKKLWTVVAVKAVVLAGAATAIVNFDIKPNKLVKTDYQTSAGANNSYIGGQTYCIMTVHRGSIVNDITTSVAAEIPTYGVAKIGYILNYKYTACAVAGNSSRLNTNRALLTIPFGATGANMTTMNIVDAEENLAPGGVAPVGGVVP